MTDEAVSGWKYEIHVSKETTFGKTITKLFFFAFQTIFFLLKKSESRWNFNRVRRVCSGLYLFQISIVKALDVHCIESKRLNDIE